ncbi:MAG TPA: AAA family ATPase [Thermoanaerobaculia bacterium]|nr:AAA family ATPase [Thermoanaerobaculia bacterium]
MFRLHNIEISGFKSFVDPVRTEFAEGITAIVGPNGCGKSNLSEAITWVLGEQSAKTLRGGRMEDVIFSGTDRRAPLGMAEVSLTLLAPGFEHARDGKLTLGRRVFRSGESMYRLNDRVVRLKDIRDLLMDTGLGIRAYSVIEQGKIGQILSGRPQERRRLIEEAAGITRYRQRKRLAELKLEEATANRMRLDDILAEVERSLRALKRQAGAARRFQERDREHRALLRRLLVAKSLLAQRELRRLHEALTERTDLDAALAARLTAAEAELQAARLQLDELQDQSGAWYRRSAELDTRVEGLTQRIQGARRTREEVASRLDSGTGTAERRALECDTQIAALADLDEQQRGLAAGRDGARQSFEESHQRVAAAAGSLREHEQALDQHRAELMASLGRVNEQQSRLHRVHLEGEKSAFRRERLEQEIADRDTEIQEGHKELSQAQHRIEELETAVASQRVELERKRAELDARLRREGEATKLRQRAEEDARALEHRRSLLEELAAADDERRAGVRSTLEQIGLADARFLEDLARAPEGWEDSVDLYLSSLRDAVVLPEGTDALEVASRVNGSSTELRVVTPADGTPPADLYARSLQRSAAATKRRADQPSPAVTLAPQAPVVAEEHPRQAVAPPAQPSIWRWLKSKLFRSRPAPAETAPPQPSPVSAAAEIAPTEGARPHDFEVSLAQVPVAQVSVTQVSGAADVLTASDEPLSGHPAPRPLGAAIGLPDAVARALPPAYLVDTAEEAADLARRHPGVAFLARGRVVGLAGMLGVRGGAARPGALSRARELEALAGRDQELRHAILAATAELGVLVQERTALAAGSRQAEGRLGELQKEHAVAQARRQDAANRLQQLERERTEVEEERRGLVAEAERIARDHALHQHDLEGTRAQHAGLERRLDELQAAVDGARQELEKLRAEDAVHSERLRLFEERLAAQAAEVARLDRQRQAAAEFLAHWQRERDHLETRDRELGEEIGSAEREQQQALEERGTVEERRRSAQERLEERRAATRSLEERVRELRTEREEERSRLEALRIGQAEQRREAEHVAEAYWSHFHVAVPLLASLRPAAPLRATGVIITAVPAPPHGGAVTTIEVAAHDEAAVVDLVPEETGAEARLATAITSVAALEIATTVTSLPQIARSATSTAMPAAVELILDPAALLAQAEEDLERLPSLDTEVRSVKDALDRMGPVNVLAAQEHTEQEERSTFLSEQRADLLLSIEILRRTIREINETSHERFTKTFDEVNVNFSRVFAELFRGGEATMRLLDDEDPLESGLEIVARPPGKRLQNLQLLSGGEKALTAIALLFALFLTKPSPFCILDEVDAPLDDANVLLFVELLERMAKDTQFLVITHNKLTMEAASSLYGVTMEEKGVSKLVAVDLDQLHPADRMAS